MQYRPEDIRDPETGKWLNSKVFNVEGRRYQEHQYYCSDPKGSPAYKTFWDEQLRRNQEGYSVAGWKITGHHYEYMNYSRIQVAEGEEGEKKAIKLEKNPDFWDGDYDYYWGLEIAENGVLGKYALASNKLEKEVGKTLDEESSKDYAMSIVEKLRLRVKLHRDYLGGGYNFIIGKARRKGYSFKNAAICANTYNSIRKSIVVIGAFDSKYLYPEGTMAKASEYLSFFNEHTAFGKGREYIDQVNHKKASFRKSTDGIPSEAGYQSQIIAVTFKDNPDSARGKDGRYVLFEEAGKFPNLKASYNATRFGSTAGSYSTGMLLIFGTGGDMESGTADFADMFYHPLEYGLMPFYNIWDENAEGTTCGFFHPFYWNMEGYYDEQGNSDIEGAIRFENKEREIIKKNSTSSRTLQDRMQEMPFCPAEAFLMVSVNDFPVVELRQQYQRVMMHSLHTIIGTPVFLLPQIPTDKEKQEAKAIDPITGELKIIAPRRKIKVEMDLEGRQEPLWTYKPSSKHLEGAIIIYEQPIPDAPKGLYKIGYDPYRHDKSTETHPSLAAIYVYKTIMRGETTRNIIVASYVGRPATPDDANAIFERLIELYNTEGMFENEVTSVKTYFERRKKLHLLALQPDAVINANVKKSGVARTYGMHMTEKLKDAGEKYIKNWLLEERDIDENGNILLNLHFIYDPALLEELVLYNRKGNFDRVMALMQVMFQIEEEELGHEHKKQELDSVGQDLIALMQRQFQNTSIYSNHYTQAA